mgnify:CR=1 FL=1
MTPSASRNAIAKGALPKARSWLTSKVSFRLRDEGLRSALQKVQTGLVSRALLIALLYVFAAWTIQAWLFASASAPTPQATAEATAATTGDRLLVHYPQRIDPILPTGQWPAIAVWLLVPQVPSTFPPTGAPALTPAAPSPTATLTNTAAIALPAPSPTAAAIARVYELRLEAPWANLVDAAGAPASGVWRATPAPAQATPIMAYLDPAAVDGSQALTLTAWTETGGGEVLSLAPKIIVRRGAWAVGWRRWLGLATDPTSVAAALLAVIVGAAVKWSFEEQARRRQEEEARRRQQEERERERLSESSQAIRELQRLLQTDPIRALQHYGSLLAQRDQGQFPWDDQGAADRLTSAWKENAPEWLQRYYTPWRDYAPGAIDARWTAEVAQHHKALANAYTEGPRPIQARVIEDLQRWLDQVVRDLQKSEGNDTLSDQECAEILKQAFDPWVIADVRTLTQRLEGLRTALQAKGWSASLEIVTQADNQASQSWTWPTPWSSSERPPERKAVEEMLGKLEPKLNFNPFGPERAEWDCELPKFARLDLIKRAAGPRPVIVLGDEGAGKTATALLLARQETLRTFDADAFPVYPVTEYRLDRPMARADWLDAVESAFAAYHLRFLARNYRPFVASAGYRQAVLLLLLRRYGAIDGLVHALHVETEGTYNDVVVDLMRAEAFSANNFPLTEAERIHLLQRAIPAPQRHAYVIMELEQPPSAGRELLASNLGALLDLVAPLAQNRIYAKIIAPADFPISCGWIERVELSWSPEDLKKALSDRFRAAGPAAFAQFCDLREGDLTDRLIELNQNNPRRLVQIGNELWRRLAAAGRHKIIAADLEGKCP